MTAGRGTWVRITGTVIACVCGLVAFLPVAAKAEFGFQPNHQVFSLSTVQAGAHPDLSASFKLNADENEFPVDGTLKDIAVATPPGFSGSAIATPTCTEAELFQGECSKAAQVGTLDTEFFQFGKLTPYTHLPIYNLTPSANAAAEFGSNVGVLFNVVIKVSVRPNDYGLTTESRDNPDLFPVLSAGVTLWGVPADHNGSGGNRRALLTNPSVCGTTDAVQFSADSWQAQGQFSTDSVSLPPFIGCAQLPALAPLLDGGPGAHEAGQPTSFDVNLEVPQVDNPDGVATPTVHKVTVALPEGMHISPPAADGLQACSDSQVGFGSVAPVECPNSSKVGALSVETPALQKTLSGALYIGEPEPENRYRLILVVEGPGVMVKLPGSVTADRDTGQLTATFEDTPQLPFSAVRVHLKGGSRALLANPNSCGTYTTTIMLTPYGGGPVVTAPSSFSINEGCGPQGFEPMLRAGAVNPTAGSLSPFVFQADRRDGEQNIDSLDVLLPPGELAKLAGVPLCSNELAASGNCPSASQIGTTTVSVGSGSSPLWVPQPHKDPTAVYLAGPYRGAPFSIVVKVPAQAGPYDLGVVVVRSGIHVDPETSQVTVRSDPLPQIIEGIPIAYRTIHVDIDRPDFALNPTNCEPMSVSASIRSTAGALATPSDRFQVGSCASLGFKPKLSMRLTGPTHRGAFPAFHGVLKMPKGGANIARASVRLPPSEFVENAHFRNICTRVQFAAEECPAASVYGHVVAKTPLLEQPLSGPVYLRSSSHQLPDLVADLRGQIHVVLDGRIDSVNGGLRAVFQTVPDAPVSQFKIDMQGRSKGLLVNSENLCQGTHRSVVKFTAQNGRVWNARIPLKAGCGK